MSRLPDSGSRDIRIPSVLQDDQKVIAPKSPNRTVTIRFYAELNDLLKSGNRQRDIVVPVGDGRSVKDLAESFGIPHTEIDMVLCDGESCGLDRVLRGGEMVSVYPVFESVDLTKTTRIRATPLRNPAFILDAHLGGLLRLMRILGLDAVLEKGRPDRLRVGENEVPTIVARSLAEGRIIVTRSRKVLKTREVTHGYLVRSSDPVIQCREVVDRFDLKAVARPLTVCITCGGTLAPAGTDLSGVPPGARTSANTFERCSSCGKPYWDGSHLPRLEATVALLLDGVRELYEAPGTGSGAPDKPTSPSWERGSKGQAFRKKEGVRLLFRLTRFNRNSVRALLCGVKTLIGFEGLDISFVEDPGAPRKGRRSSFDGVPDYAALELSGRDVVAVSFATCDRRAAAAEMSALRALPDPPLIVAGGPHPSGLWFDALAMGADMVFVGEGEASFSRFLAEARASAAGLDEMFRGIRAERNLFVEALLGNPSAAAAEFGLSGDSARSGRVQRGTGVFGPYPTACVREPGDPVDLSSVPSFLGEYRLLGAVELTRGCHMTCGFCQTPRLFPGMPRHRAPDAVIRDVREAGLAVVRFLCPDLFSYPWLEELLSGLRGISGIREVYAGTFPGEVRPERITAGRLSVVAAFGSNRSIVIGGQSGSDRLLREMGRGHGARAILDGCELCHTHGFRPYLQMIAGIPGESDEDGAATALVCDEAVRRWDARIHMHTFMPLPGASMGFMRPSPIPPAISAFMNDYECRGFIEGHWRSQEEGNQEVADLYRQYGIWD